MLTMNNHHTATNGQVQDNVKGIVESYNVHDNPEPDNSVAIPSDSELDWHATAPLMEFASATAKQVYLLMPDLYPRAAKAALAEAYTNALRKGYRPEEMIVTAKLHPHNPATGSPEFGFMFNLHTLHWKQSFATTHMEVSVSPSKTKQENERAVNLIALLEKFALEKVARPAEYGLKSEGIHFKE